MTVRTMLIIARSKITAIKMITDSIMCDNILSVLAGLQIVSLAEELENVPQGQTAQCTCYLLPVYLLLFTSCYSFSCQLCRQAFIRFSPVLFCLVRSALFDYSCLIIQCHFLSCYWNCIPGISILFYDQPSGRSRNIIYQTAPFFVLV
jgi:hypothetical protein